MLNVTPKELPNLKKNEQIIEKLGSFSMIVDTDDSSFGVAIFAKYFIKL